MKTAGEDLDISPSRRSQGITVTIAIHFLTSMKYFYLRRLVLSTLGEMRVTSPTLSRNYETFWTYDTIRTWANSIICSPKSEGQVLLTIEGVKFTLAGV